MTFELRDYQADLAKRAFQSLAKSKSVVIQLETGAGKTHIAAKMCRTWVREKKRVWFVAHRQEILDQARAIFDEAGIAHGPGKRVEFRMIAAAVRGVKAGLAPDVIVIDECHHSAADTWVGMIAGSPKALRLGLTATPARLDRKPLSDYFAGMIQGPPPRELRDAGYLAKYRYFAPVVPDLSGVKVRKAEYDRAEVTEIMSDRSIVGDVVEHYKRHAAGKRAILFAVSVKASLEMAGRFNAADITALHVDADSDDKSRADAIELFRQGIVKVLCNVELFTEGFDVPTAGAVILLRPTMSLTLCRQMIGRVARPSGRAKTVILDHAALCGNHGFPDTDYEWGLDGKPRRKSEIDGEPRARVRRCPECTAAHPWGPTCVECGYEYGPQDREVTEIGGELREVREPPPGYVTIAQYAKMTGLSKATILRRINQGMPCLR